MTIAEKKKMLESIISKIPEENLDEVLMLIEELVSKDPKRKEFLRNLLSEEENLFKRLA